MAYVTIKYALSPRAKTWVLEKSLDGETWHPWQYFASSRDQCLSKFGEVSEIRTTDSTPICTSEYTDFVPATNGEVGARFCDFESLFTFVLSQFMH